MVTRVDFNEEYYENGIASGTSGYTNFRWMPELSIPFAHRIARELGLKKGDRVLDYGCAKGFMVNAFRLLDFEAYGCDISEYAIKNAHPGTENYIKLMNEDSKIPFEDNSFAYILAKDVYEHIPIDILKQALSESARVADKLFVIVPLGNGEKYVVPSYENDITHIHRESKEWWSRLFEDNAWEVDKFEFLIPGMKDNYGEFKEGNGFFFLRKKPF